MSLREQLYMVSLLWVAVLIFPAHAAWAAEGDLDSKAGALDRGVTNREERSAIFTKFGVPNSSPFNTLPPGQALVLWSLCGSNAGCQTQALADRKGHMGWGEIGKDLTTRGLSTDEKVGQAVRRVTDAHRDLVTKNEKPEKLGKNTEKVEKMQKPEKMERVERPERPERPGR